MSRDLGPRLFVLLLLTVLAAFAWLTRHPEAPVLERAQSWPYVGPVASWLRELYLPPPRPDVVDLPAAETAIAVRRPKLLPSPPGSGPSSPGEKVWILPGAVLRGAPSDHADRLHEFEAIAVASRLARQGDWFRVRHLGREGWVLLEGYDESGGPPYGNRPEPPRALAPRPPDEEDLALARRLLGERERTLQLGPYTLYTDARATDPRDQALIDLLGSLAAQVDGRYVDRYGLSPVGTPLAALVLYRSELPYQVLLRRSEHLAGLHATGFANRGLAVFYVGDRRPAQVGSTLVHELVHFLNRRALGPALPPWLDEGLADDLGSAAVEDGLIRPRRLGGERVQDGDKVQIFGGLASLVNLRNASREGTLPALEELLSLDWDGFVRSDRSRLFYSTSAFLVRFLLEGESGQFRDRFQSFLAGVAEGEPPTAETLLSYLDQLAPGSLEERLAELDQGFRSWIEAEAQTRQLTDFTQQEPGAGGDVAENS